MYVTMLVMLNRFHGRAFSLIESVIALFLLSFAALSVLSMTQTGFQAQRRSQEIAKANLAAQSLIAEIRMWAEDFNNFRGAWAPYDNVTLTRPDYPEYTITVRVGEAGRPIDSPCAELESQWIPTPGGARVMPNAIKPVEITVAWSPNTLDRMTVLTYIGEPKRDTAGVLYDITGPSTLNVSQGSDTSYTIRMRDSGGIYFDNIMWQWIPDIRYFIALPDSSRDGRSFHMERLTNPGPPDVPPPTPPVPSPVTCYARYAGEYMDARPPGVLCP